MSSNIQLKLPLPLKEQNFNNSFHPQPITQLRTPLRRALKNEQI